MNKELLESVSKQALKLGDFEFHIEDPSSTWIGNEPASADQVEDLQQRLGVSLPQDYVAFLRLTNGFPAPCYTEPSFMSCDEVDYLRNIDAELIDIWRETDNADAADLLHRSICIGGKDEEQYFLLIPPVDAEENWRYWKFADWIPGEEVFEGLAPYFQYIESFMNESLDN